MSTTIYHGKLLPEMDVYELNAFYKQLRSEILPMAKREYYKLIVRICQEIYVYIRTGQYPGHYHLNLNEIKEKSKEFLSDAKSLLIYAQEFVNETIKTTSNTIFAYEAENDADFDVSLVVIPIIDSTVPIKHKILGMPYANHDVLYDLLTKRPEMQDYGYWNNTDKPKDVSDDEWEQRRKDWDDALVSVGIPKDNGMVLHIVDAISDVIEFNYINVRTNFMALLGDDDELLLKVANGVIMDREFTKLLDEMAGDDKEKRLRYGMKCLRLATEYIKEHPDEVEAEKNNYRHMFNSKEYFAVALYSN